MSSSSYLKYELIFIPQIANYRLGENGLEPTKKNHTESGSGQKAQFATAPAPQHHSGGL